MPKKALTSKKEQTVPFYTPRDSMSRSPIYQPTFIFYLAYNNKRDAAVSQQLISFGGKNETLTINNSYATWNDSNCFCQ